jgi:hypothetical protein
MTCNNRDSESRVYGHYTGRPPRAGTEDWAEVRDARSSYKLEDKLYDNWESVCSWPPESLKAECCSAVFHRVLEQVRSDDKCGEVLCSDLCTV